MTTYLNDSEGKFIPATQRPDGTWRKARRVKQGYVPQEEVPLYESKGKQFATRSKAGLPPGMCPMVAETAKKERERQEKVKAKQQEKKANAADIVGTFSEISTNNKKQKQQARPGMLHLPAPLSEQSPPTSVAAVSGGNAMSSSVPTTNDNLQSVDDALSTYFIQSLIVQEDAQEVSRKLKKLRKKIREIEAVEEKINKGDQKKIDKDQLDKVKRKKDILKEIEQLEQKQREIEAYAEDQKEFQQQQLQLSNGIL